MLIHELKQADPAFLNEMLEVLRGDHGDPHHFLGLHPFFNDKQVICLYRPGAQTLFVEVQGKMHPARRVHEAGFFDLIVDCNITYSDYRIYHQNGLLAHDPYAFMPIWGELDSYLFAKGVHYKLFEMMGAHPREHQGVQGVHFTVWAPNAKSVALVGDFNFWDGRVNPMRCLGHSGVWELFIPGLQAGERYKFHIKTQQGEVLLKSDPYAFSAECRPHTASVVVSTKDHPWEDQAWIEKRSPHGSPMNIYEVHLGSWQQDEHGKYKNYRDLACALSSYCLKMGYTHVELMPIEEHPLDESWGYQVTGFFAVTSRYGSVQDFQWFVDHLHQHGIGVILDWVPGHFPTDGFSLARFDGTALYEHADPKQGWHPHWSTYIFNYGRHEVTNFLLASALFWLQEMHIDGLRVDAVASMLYLDYGRQEGEWIPNRYGGKENLEAIEFLKHLHVTLHQQIPGVFTVAEESTAFPGVTRPVEWGGLGFDFKWNMGWMHDTLRYFHKDPLFRRYHHQDLTFGLLYAFSEQFVLPFSHDEVVHGKGSLLSKMPGDYWQKFANLRLLITYMMCQPGKKLMFMGAELGQWKEWCVKEEMPWYLLEYPIHSGLQTLVREINHFYLQHDQLWKYDAAGFEWVDFSDYDNSLITYKRKSEAATELLCLHNFTPSYHPNYWITLPRLACIREVFNSDDIRYGGSGKVQVACQIHEEGVYIQIPPLATMIFEISSKKETG